MFAGHIGNPKMRLDEVGEYVPIKKQAEPKTGIERFMEKYPDYDPNKLFIGSIV